MSCPKFARQLGVGYGTVVRGLAALSKTRLAPAPKPS
jgi:hypothetical protein